MKLWICAAAMTAMAVPAWASTPVKPADVKPLLAVEDKLCAGEKALDIDMIMSLYVPGSSLHVFDMMLPREYKGSDAFRKDWEEFVQQAAKSVPVCEVTEFSGEISGNLGVSHYIQHAEVIAKNGETMIANTRMTHVYHRVNGKWLIAHEHASYPIDWKTGVADRLSKP